MNPTLEALARSYLNNERYKLGIPQREQTAAESQAKVGGSLQEQALRALQAKKIQQDLDFAPQDRQLQTRLTEAQIGNLNEPNHVPATVKPPDVGSFTDYVVRKYGQSPTPAQIAEARKTYQQADDRPQAPAITIVQSDQGFVPIDRRNVTPGQPLTGANGQPLGRPDTVAQRNAAAGVTPLQLARKQAQDRAVPILQDLGSRITTINQGNQGGIVDRATGVGRGVASRVGLDPATDLYRTGIRGFVPLFARAVGHTGVLTEIDVQRTEELFPRVGDSDAVTAEKMARIQRIMTGQEPAPFQFEHPEYDSEGITTSGQAAPTTPDAKSLLAKYR